MYDWLTEESESDTRTSYQFTKILWKGATEFCKSVVIMESPVFGRMLFLDGELQSASVDEHIYHEALVHPVMTSCESPRGARVLVVGGGEGATVREVMKWKPAHVDWVDIDSELVMQCAVHLQWAPSVLIDTRVTYYPMDIRNALPILDRKYEVIILDLPDPDGDTGYLYSDAFWTDIRGVLAPGGQIVTHCGPVRPFGSIGAGFQRLKAQFGVKGFYSQMIPSFQSEWGFMIWSEDENPVHAIKDGYSLPEGLRVADRSQINSWVARPLVWRSVLLQDGQSS